ncbi:hypothetical protein B484DRAFT_61030 [Ochromonadaceae sp. CCMP2298]|nr:hypothetical protein B484DRAFT_61030 [Ochromonadaceae sp. CCMP2298]
MVKVTGYTEVQLQPAARALQLVFAQETYARSRRFAHALLELQLPLFGQQAQGQAQGRGGVQGGQGCVQYTYSSLICTITRLLTDSDTGAGTNLSAPTVPTVSPALQLYQGYLPGILEHLEGEILTDPSAALQHVPTHSEKHDESDSESLGSVGSLTQETTSGAPSPMPQSLSKQVSSSPCTQYTQGTLGTHTTAETAETAESKVSWGSRRSGRPQRAVAMPPQLQDKYRVFHVDQALLLFPSNTSTHCSDPSNPSAKGPQSILDACILQVSRLPPLFDTVKHRYPSIYSKLITCPP